MDVTQFGLKLNKTFVLGVRPRRPTVYTAKQVDHWIHSSKLKPKNGVGN